MSEDYQQPDFYRFNEDSIKLAQSASKYVTSSTIMADLGAGAGVIGLEVARMGHPEIIHFIEMQEAFKPVLEHNIDRFLAKKVKCTINITSIGNWHPEIKFDLIVSNPPYYLPGRGEPSSNVGKDLARRFSVDGWEILLAKIKAVLNPDGVALLVMPVDKHLSEFVSELADKNSFRMNSEIEGKVNFLEFRQKY